MAFVKPLKVFLSYAYADRQKDPELFNDFCVQLKSLVDDGAIVRWDDREITAGLDWDREIKEKLYKCDLFVALTSGNFNASSYIDGVEMRAALDRHDQGLCRIIPILWRDWPVTKRFEALQFPNRNNPVADAEKKDALLRTLVGHIERVVKEMTEGRWVPKQPALPRIDPALAYLCDWMRPILQLSDLRQPAGESMRPCVLALIGAPGDCGEEFLSRTHRAELPRALDFEAPVHDMCLLDWPDSPDLVSGFLHACLGARPGWEIEKKLREGLTPVRTVALGWSAEKESAFAGMLREVSDEAWALPPNRRLVLAVLVVVSRWKKKKVQKRIETEAKRWAAVRVKAIALPRIEKGHAMNWPDLPEVLAYRGEKSPPMKDEIGRIYLWRRRLAMKRLAPRLLTILQESRRQGAMI